MRLTFKRGTRASPALLWQVSVVAAASSRGAFSSTGGTEVWWGLRSGLSDMVSQGTTAKVECQRLFGYQPQLPESAHDPPSGHDVTAGSSTIQLFNPAYCRRLPLVSQASLPPRPYSPRRNLACTSSPSANAAVAALGPGGPLGSGPLAGAPASAPVTADVRPAESASVASQGQPHCAVRAMLPSRLCVGLVTPRCSRLWIWWLAPC